MARQIRTIHELGVSIGVVVGGGNFWRGSVASAMGIDRVTADHAGMLATVINALALQDMLEQQGVTGGQLGLGGFCHQDSNRPFTGNRLSYSGACF